jgi:hypothetical protein
MAEDELTPLLKLIKVNAEKCLEILEGCAPARQSTKRGSSHAPTPKVVTPDFSKPIRAFIKSYAKGIDGPAKFVLLLSYLARGDEKKEVATKDIEKQWSRMTSETLLGMAYHRSYPRRAAENDWVDSRKQGLYFLRPEWKNIFTESNG